MHPPAARLFFFSDENSQPYRINAPGLATLDTITNGAGLFWENPLDILYFQEGRLDNESWAAFGEVDFDLSDKWSLTLGLRYSVDDYNGEEVQIRYYDLYREFGFFGRHVRSGLAYGDLLPRRQCHRKHIERYSHCQSAHGHCRCELAWQNYHPRWTRCHPQWSHAKRHWSHGSPYRAKPTTPCRRGRRR